MTEQKRYRKRPVVVDAFQWQGFNSLAAFDDWLDSIGTERFESRIVGQDMLIPTLEGEMKATLGDWIIRGVKGEFYPCKPDIFAATYEPENAQQADALNRLHAAETELAAVKAQRDALYDHHIDIVTEMGEDAGWCARHEFDSGHPTNRKEWRRGYIQSAQRVLREATPTPAPDGSDPAEASTAAACGACGGSGDDPAWLATLPPGPALRPRPFRPGKARTEGACAVCGGTGGAG